MPLSELSFLVLLHMLGEISASFLFSSSVFKIQEQYKSSQVWWRAILVWTVGRQIPVAKFDCKEKLLFFLAIPCIVERQSRVVEIVNISRKHTSLFHQRRCKFCAPLKNFLRFAPATRMQKNTVPCDMRVEKVDRSACIRRNERKHFDDSH